MGLSMVPRTRPDTTTLQAPLADWQALIPVLRRMGLIEQARTIHRSTTPVLRLTFSTADAATLLRACGYAA